MFGLDTNQILMLAVVGLAVLFGVPGAKDKLLELIGNLFKPKPVTTEGKCQECFNAIQVLRAHAIEHGNLKAQQMLQALWPELFPVEIAKAPSLPVPYVPDGIDEILAGIRRELETLRSKVEVKA